MGCGALITNPRHPGYLVKDGEYEQIDDITLKRLKEIERLDKTTKNKIFDIIDTYIRDFKTRQAYTL